MRTPLIAGNWKMNTTLNEGKQLASEVINMVKDEVTNGAEVVLAPPFTHLATIQNLCNGSNVEVAAQTMSEYESGAYTGEVSANMLKSLGVKWVILGHSERREYFNETNEQLAKKLDAVLAASLKPIFCCGEPLNIREEGTQNNFVAKQLEESLFHLSADEAKKLAIAYEPIWAIGTGKTASSQQAQEMHKAIREKLAQKWGNDIANGIRILYGGSVKPDNAQELFAQSDVDGGLVGGASLKSRDFTDIVKAAR